MRYPIKTSTKEFCDTITASMSRYEKYRCWASKLAKIGNRLVSNGNHFRSTGAFGADSAQKGGLWCAVSYWFSTCELQDHESLWESEEERRWALEARSENGTVRNTLTLEGKKYTPKMFSALKTQVPQQQQPGKKLVFRGKRGKNIYTKEPSRCVWGTSSHSIGV